MKPSTVQIDSALSRFSSETMMGPSGFVANTLLPPLLTEDKTKFTYPVFGTEKLNDDNKTEITPGAPANEITHDYTTAEDVTKEYGLREPIYTQIIANADPAFSVRKDAARIVVSKLMIGREKRVKALVDSTATFANFTPTIKWDGTSPTIMADIRLAKENFEKQAGISPNGIVIPPKVYRIAKEDSDVQGILKEWNPALLFQTGLFPEIEGMKVIVPGLVYNTAEPGLTASFNHLWSGDNVILVYINPNAGPRQFGLGYSWFWQQIPGKDWKAVSVNYYEQVIRTWWEEVRYHAKEKITSTNGAYIIADTLT